jgi:hypothetical protein
VTSLHVPYPVNAESVNDWFRKPRSWPQVVSNRLAFPFPGTGPSKRAGPGLCLDSSVDYRYCVHTSKSNQSLASENVEPQPTRVTMPGGRGIQAGTTVKHWRFSSWQQMHASTGFSGRNLESTWLRCVTPYADRQRYGIQLCFSGCTVGVHYWELSNIATSIAPAFRLFVGLEGEVLVEASRILNIRLVVSKAPG